MSPRGLPPVPSLDAEPAPDAARIVERARAGAVGVVGRAEPRGGVNPSGAQLRKAGELKRVTGDPRSVRQIARELRGNTFVALPPAPDVVPARPAPVVPPEPTPAPNVEPPRLNADDVAREQTERAHAEQNATAAAERAMVLIGPERDRLEKRIGSVAQLAFTGVGYLLNHFETAGVWPLSETEKENVGILLVEAFPDECAQLVKDGMLAKVLAIGTVGRIALDRWERHNAGPVAVVQAPAAESVRETTSAPKKFAGLSDMAAA